jgi:hypothetical protein
MVGDQELSRSGSLPQALPNPVMDMPRWNSPPSRMMDHVTCGDCVQVMKDMPAQSVDFIVTDPQI